MAFNIQEIKKQDFIVQENSSIGNEQIDIIEMQLAFDAIFEHNGGYIMENLNEKAEFIYANGFTHINGRTECLDTAGQIPHNIYYIWLTNPDNPTEAPAEHLEKVSSSMTAFRNQTHYDDWNYIFYTNAPEEIGNTTEFFSGLNFTVKQINQEYSQFKTGSFVDFLIDANNIGIAADLARDEIVNLHGGVYLDVNFELARALDHEACVYDFVSLKQGSAAVENSFFMSRSEHPILEHTITDISNAFYGLAEQSEPFWQYLNSTMPHMLTNALFGLYSTNSLVYLTEQSMIYEANDASEELMPRECYQFDIYEDVIVDNYNNRATCMGDEPVGIDDNQANGKSWY